MIRTIQAQHSFHIFPTVNNVMRGFVHIAHHLEHGLLVYVEQGDNADDFFLASIIGRMEQFHRRTVFPIAFFHPGSQFTIRDFTEAMMRRDKVGLFIHNFLLVLSREYQKMGLS